MRGECSLIGAAVDIGQPNEGTDLAPSWLRVKDFRNVFEKNFAKTRDLGDLTARKGGKTLTLEEKFSMLSSYAINLGKLVTDELKKERFVFTLGGDHSLAVGTLAGTMNYDPEVKVIWVDAHSDINTPETSPSGNTHGMPVALAMGLVNHPAAAGLFDWMPKLSPKNIAYIGLRDVDPGEQKLLDDLGVLSFSADDVVQIGIEKVLEKIHSSLDPDGKSNFHISFDVDGIDPSFFPSTGTPVEGGLSLGDGKKIIESFVQTDRLVAFDLVEINPMLGDESKIEKTAASSIELISALGAFKTGAAFQTTRGPLFNKSFV